MSKLKMPPNCIDDSAQKRATMFTLVGAGPIKNRPTGSGDFGTAIPAKDNELPLAKRPRTAHV